MTSPWITIWTQPRATIGKIVAEAPNQGLWWLAWIYGFCSLMNLFQSMALGNSIGTIGIIGLAIVIGPFWGWVNFSVWSWVVAFIGKWLKGQGNFTSVRAAYAWSCVPMIVNIPLWLLMVGLFGHQLFLNFPNAHLLPSNQVTLLFAILVAKVVLAIWSLVIYLNALAEVQNFSILRAIVNVVVAGVILAVLVFVIWSMLVYSLGSVATSAFMLWKPF